MANILRHIILLLVFMAGFSVCAQAQFKEEAFTQTYNEPDDTTATNDTSDKMFSFKELFGGVAHKRDLRIGTMFAGSVVMPGISQIYNRDYWKLPVIYGGIGVCAGLGGHYLHQYNLSKKAYDAAYAQDPNTTLTVNTQAKATGTILLVGAGLIYWGSLMDGVVNYKKDIQPHPGRATLYSVLLPGLGQAYNGEYWKIPITFTPTTSTIRDTEGFSTRHIRKATTAPSSSRRHNTTEMSTGGTGTTRSLPWQASTSCR